MKTINRNVQGNLHLRMRSDGTCVIYKNGNPLRDFKTGSDLRSMENKFRQLAKFDSKEKHA